MRKKNTANLVPFTFFTMNNVKDPADLSSAECADIVNFDCDNDGGIQVRSRTISGLATQPVTEIMGSRNYWAIGNTVFCSKAMSDDEDKRFSTVISLDDMITMIRRVDGGLYIGSTTELHYLHGTDPQVGGHDDNWTEPYGVILGTGCHIRGEIVPAARMAGNCCIFATHRGVMVGGPGGSIFNLSQDRVSYDYGLFGSAFVREENGLVHYLFKTSNDLEAYNKLIAQTTIIGISDESIQFSEYATG